MNGATLGVALRAAGDRTISTEALRVYVGIKDLVVERLKNDKRMAAYVGLREVHLLSGVKPETVLKHLDGLLRLGVRLTEPGVAGGQMEGHGIATGWDTAPCEYQPLPFDPDLVEGLGRFLNPGAEIWQQSVGASSGWRASLILVATHGLDPAPLTGAWLADALGISRTKAGPHIHRLERLGLVSREGRRVHWNPLLLQREIQDGYAHGSLLLDNRPSPERIARYNARVQWLDDREADVKAKKHRAAEMTLYAFQGYEGPLPPQASERDQGS